MLDHYRQFINWHFVPDPGKKPKKVPFDPVTGFAIDPHDPKHWRSREQCATTGHPVGFVLTLRDPLWFFDLDDCKQADGKWTPEAEAVFMSFPGAAGEVSISGNGLHIMGVGDQLRLSDRKHKWISPGGLHCEFYTTGRFIALGRGFQGNFNLDWTERLLQIVPQKPAVDTSAVFGNGPVPEYTGTADDGELIRKMMASRGSIGVQFGTKASFKDLWTGDAANLSQLFKSPSDDVYDRSAADASLMVQLAYWTGKDVARMDRLFRLSALFRPKYAPRADY
ncbi:MAG: hypothetical protein KJ796_01520, partial [Alphaproteobacteria bacterium]|nr:hypothetical protein [Alphaproteobacteria bacterium]